MADNTNDTRDKIHQGYLTVGREKQIDGGITVEYKKSDRYFFVLWSFLNGSFTLEGFRDKKTFEGKRKSSGRPRGRRKSSTTLAPHIAITSSVKVHCLDMQIGRKVNHVLILMHGAFPNYFKIDDEKDLRDWYGVFKDISTSMSKTGGNRKNTKSSYESTEEERPADPDFPIQRGSRHSSASSRSSHSLTGNQSYDSCPLQNINFDFEMDDDEDDDWTLDQRDKGSAEQGTDENNCEEAPEIPVYAQIIHPFETRQNDANETNYVDDGDRPVLPRKSVILPEKTRRERCKSSPCIDNSQDSPIAPPLPPRPSDCYVRIHRSRTVDYENIPRSGSIPKAFLDMSSLPEHFQTHGVNDDIHNIEKLRWQQSKHLDGIVVTFTKAELLDTLVLVTIGEETWVAGWKKDLNNLYGRLHVGDKIKQVNSQEVKNADLFAEFVRSSASNTIAVTLFRLSKACIISTNRSDSSVAWGLVVKQNEIKEVQSGKVQEAGLNTKAPGALSKKECDWIITEIANKPVPLVKSGTNQDFVKEEIMSGDSNFLQMVVQPSDLVKKFADAQRRRGSQYY
ncbi:uncharacterized protein [Diadema antillarum]|uniref:uncharacterized protein n=1 Tax=Diadema antillarum TaxID=105358 RepID=UPI003A890FB2